MMVEAAEVIVPLLRGETVSRTDGLVPARGGPAAAPCRSTPTASRSAVASTFSPTGADAGRSARTRLLSVAATDPSGFDASTPTGAIFERTSARARPPRRPDPLAGRRVDAPGRDHGAGRAGHGARRARPRPATWRAWAVESSRGAARPGTALVHWTTERAPDLRRRDRRHGGRRDRHDRTAQRQDRRLRDVPVPRPRLRRLGGDEAVATSCSPSTSSPPAGR